MIAKGFIRRSRLGTEPDRIPTQAQRDDVCEIVAGVGEERQTIAPPTGQRFNADKSERDTKRKSQTGDRPLGQIPEVRMRMSHGEEIRVSNSPLTRRPSPEVGRG